MERAGLLHEHEVDSANDEQECQDVVPMQVVALKHDVGDDGKDCQRNALLNDFQLDEREGTAVADESHAVGRYLAAILQEGNAPRKHDDTQQGPVVADARLLKTKMPIPSKRHEDVA